MAEPGGEGQVPPTEPGTQAVPPTTNPAPGSQVPPTAPVKDPNPNNPQQGDEWEPERAKNTILQFRQREKEWEKGQKELERLRTQVQEIENAKLTEGERTQKELETLRSQQQSWQSERAHLLRDQAITAAVAGTDAKYQDLVAMKVANSELEIGEDGKPTRESLKAALKAVKEEYPDLFGKGTQPSMPPSGGPANPVKGKPLSKEVIEAMPKEERMARHDEIMQWMKDNYAQSGGR